MVSLSVDEIIKRIQSWVKDCEKAYDQDFSKEFVVEVQKADDGRTFVEFRFDSTLYEIIEYYYSDGLDWFKCGSKYANLFDGTGWSAESYSPGVQQIWKQGDS